MNWIPILEQIPDFDKPVLVCDGKPNSQISIARLKSYTVYKDSYSFSFEQGYSGLEDYYYDVLYWMPLPEKYVKNE